MSPPRSATPTRERLLDAAQAMINDQGFAATSIEKVIDQVGVTKGAFFHHFKSKNSLARALIERFAQQDNDLLAAKMQQAEKLSDDPLQQVLIFAGLMLEVAEHLDEEPHPGCLFASYCYESGLFDDESMEIIRDALEKWRIAIVEKLKKAHERHPARIDVDWDSLADMVTVALEGAYVMARVFPGRAIFSHQVRHYRNYLKLLFGAE